jgi:uncharacterized protein (TIGR02001 family)
MNRILKAVSVVAVVLVAGSSLYAAEASLSLDLASSYIFRGVTFNDGLVAQPGLEVGGLGGLSVGVWGNLDLDDYDGALADSQFSEVDIYGSYAIPVEVVDLSVGYTEYVYPGGGEADREVGISVGGAFEGVDLGADCFYGVDGAIEDSLYIELAAGSSFELCEDLGLDIGATVGYSSPDEGDDGFSHYTASLGLSYSVLSVGVTYIGQIDDDVLPDAAAAVDADEAAGVEAVDAVLGYDAEVLGTIGVAIDF